MRTDANWNTFASTGSVLQYLRYKEEERARDAGREEGTYAGSYERLGAAPGEGGER